MSQYKAAQEKDQPILDRLLSKTTLNPETGCLEWQGARDRSGYGAVRHSGLKCNAHRVVATLVYGELTRDLDACHRCDNRPCINPEHLFIGTRSDNMLDASAKGRLYINPSQPKPQWSHFVQTDLTPESLAALISEAGTVHLAAQKLGCNRKTLFRRCAEWGLTLSRKFVPQRGYVTLVSKTESRSLDPNALSLRAP